MAEIGYQTGSLPGWAGMVEETHETNPDLVWPKSNAVYDRMRREDPQIASILAAITLPLLESDWRIDATGVRDEVAEHIAADLGVQIVGREPKAPIRTKGKFSWEEHLRLAMLENVFGHSIFEQVYEIDAFGRTHLQKLAYRPPHTISEFEIARDGGLVAIKQFGAGLAVAPALGRSTYRSLTPAGDVRIPVDRLVVYVNGREGGNWWGTSILRSAYKMWLLKDRTLRVQALAAERNGLGLPAYTSAPPIDGTYAEQKAWLDEEIATGLAITKGARAGEAAGVSLRNGAKFEFVGVTGKVPDLDKQIRYYDEQMGKAALTNFLNLGGDNSTGSYALGDTFENFFTKSLNASGRHIATITQQHVIEDLVDANWGTSEPAPRLVPPRIGAEHPATAEAIRALLDSGALRYDRALEAHLRAQYGLPVIDPTRVETPPSQPEEAA